MTEPTTHTLEVPGAVVTYDIRRDDSSAKPPLLVVGSPMAANGFTTLVGHLTDRTVVTYDPRGSERSKRTDGAAENTPQEHADDLHRVIAALGTAPVDLFASSGGAVNALELVARHPEQVRTLVAHEPPACTVIEDRAQALAACQDIKRTYQREGFGAAMVEFIVLTSHEGPIPDDFADTPRPDPGEFGMPTEDDGTRDDSLIGLNLITCTHYEPDIDALRAADTRIVLAVGEESGRQLARRCGEAVARLLGTEPAVFPSHHGGFAGGEFGMAGKPEEFAATLREVLAE